MPNSNWDFDHLQAKQIVPYNGWHALMMAAMIKADSANRVRLARAFPEIWRDLTSRGLPDITRAERGDQPRHGARVSPGADSIDFDPAHLAAELSEAMGGMHPMWAPAVIANLVDDFSEAWNKALAKARAADQEGELKK